MTSKPKLNPALKLVLDLGPLLIFFAANSRFGIFAATGAFMAAILIALAVAYALTRHLPIMPLVTAIVVVVFGGLTLVLQNDVFIKLKPTIIYVLFGLTLLGGYVLNKPLLAIVFADLSMLSKAETERIWLPFTVWLTAAGALLPPRSHRWWLALNVAGALLLNHFILTNW